MRTFDEYKTILELWEQGENKKAIARLIGIPRATVRDCIVRYGSVQGLEEDRGRATRATPDEILRRLRDSQNRPVQSAYAYLLGLYLGDGAISKTERVHRIRIALDKKYPNIINACVEAIETILPDNKVSVIDCPGYVHVSCYHKFWPQIFPQDGDGPKHKRKIALEDWQQAIVDAWPLEFLCGLYHSDGSRDNNIVNGKNYPRYAFRNFSVDILNMYAETCDKLGLSWTLASNGTSINTSKRKDVDYLDSVIGPKS